MKRIVMIVLLGLGFMASGQTYMPNTNLLSANKTLPTITRPSPTVSQLMKVEEAQVDNYTGQPDVTIPLYSHSVKNLNVNLALSYNSSGIRVTEQSGWVGKGWSLSAGGVISRSVVDIPDEINKGKYKGVNYNLYHDFFKQNSNGTYVYPENGDERNRFVYDTQWGTQELDSKNDVYQFNFFGKTGRFVFTMDGSTLKPVIIGNDSNFKITAVYTTNDPTSYYPVEITSFVIIDDMGYKYYFSEIERTEKKDRSTVHMQGGCNEPVAPAEAMSIGKFISAWHLSRVEDENGIRLIEISYHSVLEKPKSLLSRTYYTGKNLHEVASLSYPDCDPDMKCALKPQKIVNESERVIESKKINRITFWDKSYIRFFISTSHPEYTDLNGAYLQSIGIYNGQDAAAVKTFNFSYYANGVFVANPLFLQYVKNNNSSVDRYAFEYYNRTLYRNFESEEKDDFGYSNFEPFNESIYTGVLTKITYPTKGTREFTWERNTYSYKGGKLLSYPEIMTNTDNYTIVENEFTDPYINDSPAPLYTTINIVEEQGAHVMASTGANGVIDNSISNRLHIIPIISASDHTQDNSRPVLGIGIQTNGVQNETLHFMPGTYKIYFTSLNGSLDHIQILGHARFDIKTRKSRLDWFLYGGGIRINTVKDKDNGADQIVKGYKYNFEQPGIVPVDLPPFFILPSHNLDNFVTFSSGSLDGLDNLIREYTVKITPIFNVPGQVNFEVEYDVYEKQNELDVQLAKGSYIGYKNVFEYFYPNTPTGSLAYKSKIKYTYDSAIDYPSLVDDSYPYFPIVSSEHKQSNIRKIEYFDAAHNPVVTEDFKYNYDTEEIRKEVKKNFYFVANEAHYAGIAQQVRMLYTSYDNLVGNTISPGFSLNCTGMPSGIASSFNLMDKTVIRKALTDSYTFVNDYKYKTLMTEHTKKEFLGAYTVVTRDMLSYRQPYNTLSAKTSLLATGDTATTQYFYATDPEIQDEEHKTQLNSKNMVAVPLRTVSLKNNEVLAVQQTKYGSVAAEGPIKTNQIASFALPLPLQNMLVPREVFSRKGDNEEHMERDIFFSRYDVQGNLIEVRQENGISVCYVWGYNKTVPVAKIENMNYETLLQTYSTQVTNIENATNATAYDEANVITALNALRTALTTSMVTGYVYKPQRGITCVIDPRGYKTTYHYDALGRLEYVKDHQGNILSDNKYNYRP